MDFEPTAEQQTAIDLFAKGGDLGLLAGAGTGKSTTLKVIAHKYRDRRVAYTAFNKAIVNSMKGKMGRHVKVRTMHGFAFDAVGREFSGRSNVRRTSAENAKALSINELVWVPQIGGGSRGLRPAWLASYVLRALAQFCQSDAEAPGTEHFRYIDGIDAPDPKTGARTYAANDMLRARMLPALHRAWEDAQRTNGVLPYSPAYFLKMWELGLHPANPGVRRLPWIGAEILMVDEAQDMAPVMLSVIKKQMRLGTRVILVGDSCQPTGTLVTRVDGRGRYGKGRPTQHTEVPIEDLAVGDKVMSYNIEKGHLRRTGSTVTGISSRPYEGSLLVARTDDGRESRYTPDHHCVVRMDGPDLRNKFVLYLMRRGADYRLGISMWTKPSQGGLSGLTSRLHQEKADAIWALDVFDTREQALEAEMTTAWRLGIPDVTFKIVQGRTLISQEMLDRFWSKVGGNEGAARRCLAEFGRDIRFPLAVHGTRLIRARAAVVRACNLISGMRMMAVDHDSTFSDSGHDGWTTVTVSREIYSGAVWSLTVENDHTYVADGLMTHNCQAINGFTGAVDAFKNISLTHTTYLTQSFRFGPDLADLANTILARLDTPLRLVGKPGGPDDAGYIGPCSRPDAILCRTNAAAVSEALTLMKAGRKVNLVGNTAQAVVSFARGAMELRDQGWTAHPELSCFGTWGQVQEYAEQDELGKDLALLVGLVDDFGPETIISGLAELSDPRTADITVSTAHQSKGLEWNTVKLAADFPAPNKLTEDELMLLYVAVTRAKNALDVTACPSFCEAPDTVPTWMAGAAA